ncbi:MAG: hypothetical protein A3F20_02665 [Candidatus Zambryskibacteria bacterium RIFCSPHIGHO2_12_FULL_39_21]|nr:MAG: hypothetical protein A3B88_00715 [Candidatus Zambryskibacteria bacterium RIFCSPHIGHO2_02_FULL_39_19]OHA99067.1 MAG: hypothetical protein A3F20_02665 [Candidatus Zambryskibacteria bacterium RIFCSPHIGHO2_12_FULL_39_21]
MVKGLKLNNWLIFQSTALGFLMLSSGITGLGSQSSIPNVAPETIEIKAPMLQSESRSENFKVITKRSITVEEYVRNYFSDIPVMIEIAKCESRFRQHDRDGDTLRGEKNNLDRGVMQINEFYHIEDSEKLGFDILTLEGNTSYARSLFEKYGVKPWSSSSRCWNKTSAYSQYKKELAMK